MRIYSDTSLLNFEFWSGAKDRACVLTYQQMETIEQYLEDLYPDGMEDAELNDFFWFEEDTIAEWLGFDSFEKLEKYNNGEEDEEEDELDEEDELEDEDEEEDE